ncbi:MAG TPA: long-chain fatty acid--CoA ligase [Candidatus Eisenbacteria bacterium]|jgi:long-chain acyl-CoA synthetase
MPDTLVQVFLDTVAKHKKPAQFMRKVAGRWESIPAERALTDVESMALGLRELGIGPGDRVAILSESRYEWPIADLAILSLGAISVPIYPTLTAEQCRFILDNSEAKAAFASTPAQLEKLRAISGRLPALSALIPIDPAPAGGPSEHAFEGLIRRGKELRAADPGAFARLAAERNPGDVATIIYTSGTTGEPKGAMLTHANIVFDVDSCLRVVDLRPSDIALSFLPLSHVFERMAGLYAMLRAGVTIAYAESMDTVAANAVEVRPTILTGVPRFYEKVYARVMENALAQPALRKGIFFWGLSLGTAMARARFAGTRPPLGAALFAPLADRLVGARVRERVGGRLRYCISGGAPLAPKIMEFFFAVGITVIEGYGLTETSPVICLNLPGRETPGSVGPPIPGVEVKIAADGEILTRGPHVMAGYFKNERATQEALRDGWFHTGDVGKLDERGALTITDRLKDLLVTAGGKKVAPQPLEARLKTSKWITEAVLIGDRRPYVVALLVPNFATLEAEARARGWSTASREELLRRPEVREIYAAEVVRLNADLAPFEQLKKFELLGREFTQEADELTPSLKIKRHVIARKFSREIEGLYASGPAAAGAQIEPAPTAARRAR